MQLSNGNMAIVAGVACRQMDYGCVGQGQTPRCAFSIYLGKSADGKGRYANCVAWRGLATHASGIQEGDAVLAAGRIDEHEHEGKVYRTLQCDFITYLPTGGGAKPAHSAQGAQSGGFTPVDDDELPF